MPPGLVTTFDRQIPLFEREQIPVEIVEQTNATEHKKNGVFTIRILSGTKSSSNENVIRVEVSDECNLIEETSQIGFNARTPASIPRLQTPVIHAPFLSVDRGRSAVIHSSRAPQLTCNTNQSIELYELEVGENEFGSLRRDQALLVDFADFSSSFISLLQLCELDENQPGGQNQEDNNGQGAWNAARQQAQQWRSNSWNTPLPQHNQHPQYQYGDRTSPFRGAVAPVSTYTCRLELASSDQSTRRNSQPSTASARLSIVESNQFRELTHLALNLTVGSNKSVRHYLSSRLSQILLQQRILQNKFSEQQQRSQAAETDLVGLNKRLQELTTNSEAEKSHLRYTAQECLQSESSNRLAEINQIKDTKEAEITSLTEKYKRIQAQNENKIRVLEDTNRNINTEKTAIERDKVCLGYVTTQDLCCMS